MAFTTRVATESDRDDLIGVWGRCGLTRPWNDPTQDFEFARGGESSTVIVLETDGAVCGGALVGHDGHRGAVYYVGVDPDLQSGGGGRVLMSALEDWLRERGVWKLNLLVRAENAQAIGFYEALGYVDQQCVALGKRLDDRPDRRVNE